MKTHTKLRILSALAVLLWTGYTLHAQTQSDQDAQAKAEYEKQVQEKDMQMKQMEMQMKKQQLELQKKMAELEKSRAERVRVPDRSSGRSFYYTVPEGSGDGPFILQSWGQDSQSQLTLRNTFNGETLSSDGEFDVDENTSHIRFTINGKVRHGEISVKLLYPGGKVFKDLTINSSAQITFSQSLTIKEEEKKKYVGAWKYEVKTKTAEGDYMLSIVTN